MWAAWNAPIKHISTNEKGGKQRSKRGRTERQQHPQTILWHSHLNRFYRTSRPLPEANKHTNEKGGSRNCRKLSTLKAYDKKCSRFRKKRRYSCPSKSRWAVVTKRRQWKKKALVRVWRETCDRKVQPRREAILLVTKWSWHGWGPTVKKRLQVCRGIHLCVWYLSSSVPLWIEGFHKLHQVRAVIFWSYVCSSLSWPG